MSSKQRSIESIRFVRELGKSLTAEDQAIRDRIPGLDNQEYDCADRFAADVMRIALVQNAESRKLEAQGPSGRGYWTARRLAGMAMWGDNEKCFEQRLQLMERGL